jgi:hypothetical protein
MVSHYYDVADKKYDTSPCGPGPPAAAERQRILPKGFALRRAAKGCLKVAVLSARLSPAPQHLTLSTQIVCLLLFPQSLNTISFPMCDYTQVEYACGHLRYTVKAWCVKYQETHKRCPANVIAM